MNVQHINEPLVLEMMNVAGMQSMAEAKNFLIGKITGACWRAANSKKMWQQIKF